MSCGGSHRTNANRAAVRDAARLSHRTQADTAVIFHGLIADLKSQRELGPRPGEDAQQEVEAEARRFLVETCQQGEPPYMDTGRFATTQSRLAVLNRHASSDDRIAAVRATNDPTTITLMARSKYSDEVDAAIEHPALPARTKAELLKHPDSEMRRRVLRRTDFTASELASFARTANSLEERGSALGNPGLSDADVRQYVADIDRQPHVRPREGFMLRADESEQKERIIELLLQERMRHQVPLEQETLDQLLDAFPNSHHIKRGVDHHRNWWYSGKGA
jgi:hypothetical protein